MMDMMTILLVFLLKQFSVSRRRRRCPRGCSCRRRPSRRTRPLAVNITVTQNAVLVEGDAVATGARGRASTPVKRDGANGYYITPLVDTLQKHANRLKKIAAMGGTQVRRHRHGAWSTRPRPTAC